MLSSYLSTSRHGVFYFRWPLPNDVYGKRRTVRISLGTKCPDQAGDLARYLTVCGRILRDNKALAGLRQDQMRKLIQGYFAKSLKAYRRNMNNAGLTEQHIGLMQGELEVHVDAIGNFADMSDAYLDAGTVEGFLKFCPVLAVTRQALR